MNPGPLEVQRTLMRLRVEILNYLDRTEDDTDFCGRCHLPLPAGDFESYEFCPGATSLSAALIPARTNPAESSNINGRFRMRSSAASVVGNTNSQVAIHSRTARIAVPLSPQRTRWSLNCRSWFSGSSRAPNLSPC